MRVAAESDRELVLEHRPIVVPALAVVLVVGVMFQTLQPPTPQGIDWMGPILGCLVGLLIAYLAVRRSRVIFDADRYEVSWQHFGWPGQTRGSCSLDDVKGVEIVSAEQGGAERITLQTSQGEVPLTRDFFGFHRYQQTATTIKQWLKRHCTDLPGAE